MRSRALGAFHRSYAALRRLLAVLTSPVRRTPAYESHVIQPYRGYGTTDHVHLRGRVFRQPRLWTGPAPGSLPRQLIDLLRRILRWGSGDVVVTARANGAETRTRTDPDGYFRIDLDLTDDPAPAGAWCDVQLEARFDEERVKATGQAYVPPTSSRFVVISDIDDTVMHTGVASKARMMWNLFMADADSRVAFPGVGAFYRALHAGADGGQGNPMLYVSRAPWSIYEVLERFFQALEIPVGPILFLREWGLTLQRPLPRRARNHKRMLIEDMLARYGDRPFILIGDSGQHDPEIYAQIIEQNPGRVEAVYIRDVGANQSRRREIEGLARTMEAAGSPLILTEHSSAMARHAAERELIAAEAADEVARQERRDTAADGA